MKQPRFMLAAPSSGSGKTMITCGILQILKNRGYRVSSFKCGPDYIDPMFHTKVLGTISRNLDTFFTGEEMTRCLFAKTAQQTDLSVIEGVMGYYDGLGGIRTKASSYDLARVTDTCGHSDRQCQRHEPVHPCPDQRLSGLSERQ